MEQSICKDEPYIYRFTFINRTSCVSLNSALYKGKRHGKGKYTWANGAFYDGEYKDNLKHGRGTRKFPVRLKKKKKKAL